MTNTVNTIEIQQAADHLGLPEGEFRKLLQGIVKNPTTAKKLALSKFKMIAESLQSHVVASEQDTVLQDEEIIEDTEETSLTTTEEESQLDRERTQVALNINLHLQESVLNLNQIMSALALVTAEESVKNFEEIYSTTVHTGINKVVSKVAKETYQTIQQLREVNNADFLEQKGRGTIETDSTQAIDRLLQLL